MALDDSESEDEEEVEEEGTDMESDLEGKKEEGKKKSAVCGHDCVYCGTINLLLNCDLFL